MTSSTVATAVQSISRAEAARLAEQCARVLVEQFGARRAIPFGSVAGDSPWHSRSDIDLAVEGLAPELEAEAWAALGRLMPPGLEVDLVELESAPPELRARILGRVKMPKENVPALKFEIEAELANLQYVADRVAHFLASTAGEPEDFAIAGVAKYLHDFYNGVERIFERIAVRLDGGLPSGEDWHIRLLERMAESVSGVRPAVIDQDLHRRLLEFLKFRHRIRHTYSHELKWPKVKERAEELGEVAQRLQAAIEVFIAGINSAPASHASSA